MEEKTQQEEILNFIENNQFITSWHASRMDIMDLQGQIKAMERKGIKFDHVKVKGEKYKRYYFQKEQIEIFQ